MSTTYEEAVKEAVGRRNGVLTAPQQVIAVLTPTLGVVSMWWHTSQLDLLWPMNTGKAFLPTPDNVGGEIAEMRNRLVSMALAAETEKIKIHSLMWIDDDVIVNRAAILALAAHDRDIASGVYFCKGEFSNPLIFPGPGAGSSPYVPVAGPDDEGQESWGWAQGLSLVRTEVYKRLRDETDLGRDKYGAPRWYEKPDFKVNESGALDVGGTEDFPFFKKCNDLGYRALVDRSQFAFGFHYDAAGKAGYPRLQWEQFIRREPIVWPARNGHPEVVWKPA